MCKLRCKVRNGPNIPPENQISSFSNLFFSNQNLYFHLRLSKTYSLIPSLKNTLGLYGFENFGRETKIDFEKSELNFEKSVGTQIYMAK